MSYDPNVHHRHSLRLKGYDYAAPGAYFITVCTQDKTPRFGRIVDTDMHLNAAGRMVKSVWTTIPERFRDIETEIHTVMPNHFHALVILGASWMAANPVHDDDCASASPPPALGEIVGAFKSITTHEYIVGVKTKGWASFDKRLWQRNYWEHIIRSQESLAKIQAYIENNPRTWPDDQLYVV